MATERKVLDFLSKQHGRRFADVDDFLRFVLTESGQGVDLQPPTWETLNERWDHEMRAMFATKGQPIPTWVEIAEQQERQMREWIAEDRAYMEKIDQELLEQAQQFLKDDWPWSI